MKHDVEQCIRKCDKCERNIMTQYHTRLPLTLTVTSKFVFEKPTLDIIGPVNISNAGNRCILTVEDDLLRFLIAVTLAEQTAEEVAKVFADNIVIGSQVLFHDGSLLHSMFDTLQLITISSSSRILTHVRQILELQLMRVISSSFSPL
jgi:hypothetical protein